MWENFINGHYDKNKDFSPGEAFKKYLKDFTEDLMTKEFKEKKKEDEELGREANDKPLDWIYIADIVFAFNNAQLINLLRKRGAQIIK